MFMSQFEIEGAHAARHACPNVRKGVHLLYRLMQAVNDQSDGWAYWNPPSKAAEPLAELLKTAGYLPQGTRGTITAAELRKAVTPIKSMVTRQKKLQAKFGNTFDFDVEAALKEAEEVPQPARMTGGELLDATEANLPRRITYGELLELLNELSPEQLQCNVTVELGVSDECFPAEFRIAGDEHASLDTDHPVIYVKEA